MKRPTLGSTNVRFQLLWGKNKSLSSSGYNVSKSMHAPFPKEFYLRRKPIQNNNVTLKHHQ